MIHGTGDIRVQDRDDPRIQHPGDAIIRVSATCVCGSDLWLYRGVETTQGPSPIGHEYVGIVEEVGAEVTTVEPGQFVIGGFAASDNTCEICRDGYQSSCISRQWMDPLGAQAQRLRVPLADGTLVATPHLPDKGLIPSLLTASDVLGTAWFGAETAHTGPGKIVNVIGDGAVGLLSVLAAKNRGAERIIAVSTHPPRQHLARQFGATDIVTERGHDATASIREATSGLGAHSVIEAVGTQQSLTQAQQSTRPGGYIAQLGLPHNHHISAEELFSSQVHLHGGPAPIRRYLPELIDLILHHDIDPGQVFDLTLPLEQAHEGYKAMDQRRAVKTFLTPPD